VDLRIDMEKLAYKIHWTMYNLYLVDILDPLVNIVAGGGLIQSSNKKENPYFDNEHGIHMSSNNHEGKKMATYTIWIC
jgi:hypothetical protein